MKPTRTIAEAKALADRAAKRLAQEAERKACAEALRKWRRIPVLWKWREERR